MISKAPKVKVNVKNLKIQIAAIALQVPRKKLKSINNRKNYFIRATKLKGPL